MYSFLNEGSLTLQNGSKCVHILGVVFCLHELFFFIFFMKNYYNSTEFCQLPFLTWP